MKNPSILPKNLFFLFKNWQKTVYIELSNFTLFQIYRNWAKKSISRYLTDNNNFEVILNLSLFIFAFSQMIWLRYQEKSFSLFLKNTFPGVCLPYQAFSWDTFSTIFINQNFQTRTLQLEEVEIYPNSLVLLPKSNKYFNQKLFDIGVLPIKRKSNFIHNHKYLQSHVELFPATEQAQGFNQLELLPKGTNSTTLQEEKTNLPLLELKQEGTNKFNATNRDYYSERTTNKAGNIGSTRSSFFSYRFYSKIPFFKDEFPSKLDSNFSTSTLPHFFFEEMIDLIESQQNENEILEINSTKVDSNKVSNNLALQKEKRKTIFFKNSIPQKKTLSGLQAFSNSKPANQINNFKNKVLKPNFAEQDFLKFQIVKSPIDNVKDEKNASTGFYWKAILSQKKVFEQKIYTATSKKLNSCLQQSKGEVRTENKNNRLLPASEQRQIVDRKSTQFGVSFFEKKNFFRKQIINFSHQTGINPFVCLENVFQAENEKSRNFKVSSEAEESFSQNFFQNICSYDILDSISSFNAQKHNLWLNSKLRSGFFYPDESNSSALFDQLAYQKNPILNFYKKTLTGNLSKVSGNKDTTKIPFEQKEQFPIYNGSKKKGVLPAEEQRQLQQKLNIFRSEKSLELKFKNIGKVTTEILPIEVFFHPNIYRSQIEKTLDFFKFQRENELTSSEILCFKDSKKNQLFDFKYRPLSLVVKNQTFYNGDSLLKNQLTFEGRNDITKWVKEYYSPRNFLKDRKDNFFGYLPQFFQEKGGTHKDLAKVTYNKTEKIVEILIPVSYFDRLDSKKFTTLHEDKSLPDYYNFIADRSSFSEFFKNLPVILCNEKWQIPYLKNEEWESILEGISRNSNILKQTAANSTKVNSSQGLTTNPLNNLLEKKVMSLLDLSNLNKESRSQVEEEIELSIPLIRIALPTLVSGDQDFGFQHKIALKQPWPLTFIDYKPNDLSSFFGRIFNPTQFKYKSLPWSRSQWNPHLVSKISFGEVYKRETTIFSNQQRKNFLSNWALSNNIPFFLTTCFNTSGEPVTLNSWMFLNQFCFVLFSLKVCQWCYQEYGKEVIVFLIEALESLGVVDEGLKEDFQLQKSGSGSRILKSINKRFKDVAGVDKILPDLSEIVWFLRNSGRSFKMGKIIPKGILFIGPPGTGKTFLASAIAGEAEVPVLVQSGSTLSVPNQPGKGAERLKNLFYQARELAPCIIFIDEIDTLGEKRQHITRNPLGEDEIFETLGNTTLLDKSSTGTTSNDSIIIETNQSLQEKSLLSEQSKAPLFEKKGDQLNILTQFLVEMDGLESRQGIIVIGATNRPGILDPAFTRPGRFDQIIQLEFPTKQKRIEIFKLYSKNLGINSTLSWNYLANRTSGCSAADLSAAMNESSIQAILKDTTHTVETIEQGLDFIQNSTRQKLSLTKKNNSHSLGGKTKSASGFASESQENQLVPSLAKAEQGQLKLTQKNEAFGTMQTQDPFFLQRLAYSQAGKAVLFTLLPQHPFPIFLNLWTLLYSDNLRKANSVSKPFSTRLELENKLVGLYAGKACELLVLFKNASSLACGSEARAKAITTNFDKTKKSKYLCSNANKSYFTNPIYTLWESDLNREDMLQASSLAQSMINRWFFYSKKVSFQKWNGISTNQNEEILEQNQDGRDLSFLKKLALRIEIEPKAKHAEENCQKFSFRAWWQNNVAQQTGSSRSKYFFSADWYRIYLPDPEESLRNEEFIPSDEYYHNENRSLNLLTDSKKSSSYWNDLYKNNNDFLYQALILSSFNKAFSLLDQNREIIDFFADFILRYETIREKEISHFLLKFRTKNLK